MWIWFKCCSSTQKCWGHYWTQMKQGNWFTLDHPRHLIDGVSLLLQHRATELIFPCVCSGLRKGSHICPVSVFPEERFNMYFISISLFPGDRGQGELISLCRNQNTFLMNGKKIHPGNGVKGTIGVNSSGNKFKCGYVTVECT